MSETAFDLAQFDASYPPGIEAHFWNHARNRMILHELRRLAVGGKLNRVLEIGCGRGVVLAYLRRHGIDCHGIELSPVPVPTELEPYLQTGANCFDLPEEARTAVDCLLLLDVLEHLPEPVAFLSRLRESFPNARALIITVPARSELWSNYDEYYGHFRRYIPATLNSELKAAGFSSIRSAYMFKALYPVMFVLAKLFRNRTTTIAAPGGSFLHRLLSDCFVIEHRLMPRRLWGTSVLATFSPAGRGKGI
jgi:2-polyprenyl-3-methyl-5-hydroxy-6-metoxy-1,4-benzoquinol methylase